MKKHSRRAFVKRSAAAVVSCLLSGGGPVGGLHAAQARRRDAALPQMPVTCYLRRLSAQKVRNPSGQEEVSFLSGNPLSEDEARAARSAGVKFWKSTPMASEYFRRLARPNMVSGTLHIWKRKCPACAVWA